jgi:hypothetical protein
MAASVQPFYAIRKTIRRNQAAAFDERLAVGVSDATSQQDGQCAKAGAQIFD